ncbi:MAG: hypothetical protein IPG45_09825 [Deltaproteobacteria bacterium]|nr:hypothetical protein [Deltaproteobacteria bacterium]
MATAFKALFTTKAGIAITAGTAGLVMGSNAVAGSYAMNSPAMMQMSMMRGGMPMGYPGIG